MNIGMRSFYKNQHIKTLNVPETIADIKKESFMECNKLKEINFDSPNLAKIQPYAFSNCTSLKTVMLPNNCV